MSILSRSRQKMQLKSALKDFWDALKSYRIWWYFAWMETKQRYRRSILGPWWITLSMLIFIIAMGIVYSRLFKVNIDEYIPFFTAGFLFWTFTSSCITEATEVFKNNAQFIKQLNLPFGLYIFKHLTKHVIFLGHNLVAYILIMVYFEKIPNYYIFLVIPGFILLTLNLYWISLLVSLLSTRFRDMIPIVLSCMQIAFFITPITWMPKLLNPHSFIIKLNPLVYLIEIVRAPLLGTAPMPRFWLADSLLVLLGFTFTFIIFSRAKNKIAFWID